MNSQRMFGDPFGIAILLVVVGIAAMVVGSLGRLCVTYPGVRRPLLFVVLAAGGVAGYNVLRTSSGYLAGLVWEQAVFMMLLVGVASVVLAAIPRTRRYGLFGVLGTAAMLAGFFTVYLGGYYLGVHAWTNDRPIPLQ